MMSALTRAKQGFWWINLIALALSAMIGRMSYAAYESIGESDKALVCITCQALAIALAVLARRAMVAGNPVSGVLCGLGALGCAVWASHGLALAWGAENQLMVVFLTALEPAMFLMIEHIKESRLALAEGDIKRQEDERALARELTEIRARQALGAVAGGALAATPAQALAAEPAGALYAPPPAPSASIVSLNTGYATPKAHVLALRATYPDWTVARIARAANVKRTTASYWLHLKEKRDA